MPSPIAHLGVGYAIYRHYKTRLPQDKRRLWKFSLQLILVTGLSLLPDLDVIPAILFRDMRAYHNNISHSLFAGIPAALVIAGIFQRIYRSNFWLWFVICLISYDLHILMDILTADRGSMLFWPFTETRYAAPIKIFYGLQWGLGWFSPWHLWTIFTESIFVAIVVIAMHYFDRRRNHVQEKHT
jgi:inner membrane protein